jgi:pyruvate/2-oxoglutarate dehydrogenase complex dihydrolipoamide acyltransferase (E2) component
VSATTTEPASRLRCPRCGANLAPDQDWCLECGAAATTRILRPPSWKLAAAIVLGVIAAVVVATVIVVNALSGDAHRAAATPSSAPAATAAAKPKPAPATTAAATTPTIAATSASATTPAAPTTGPAIASWPRGRSAWTVVLATTSSRRAAEQRARDLIANGVRAGILDASKFTIDASGAPFVVFTGQFPSQDGAVSAESRLGGRAPSAVFVAQVSPR